MGMKAGKKYRFSARQKIAAAPLEFVDSEFSLSMTYITVANLAFHMGDEERGAHALRVAEDARSEAKRAALRFSSNEQNRILARAAEINELLFEVLHDEQPFGSYVQQPSMS